MTLRAITSARSIVIALLVALASGGATGTAAAAGSAWGDSSGGVAERPHRGGPAWLVAHRTTAADAPAHARLTVCRRSPQLDGRVAVVGAWMRPLDGATRLALRIDLLQRAIGMRRWTRRTDVPGLGAWTSPSDTLVGTRAGDVFKYRQAVARLAVSAAYRFRVAFRWFDAAGAIVRDAVAVTRPCRQPDLRPDLVLDEVRTTPSARDASLVRYVVVVHNVGRLPAIARVAVAATLPGDGEPAARQRIAARRLGTGERTAIAFTGPGCVAGAVPALFTVDPSNLVDEADEANNELTARCPAP